MGLLCILALLCTVAFAADKPLEANHVDSVAVSLTEYFAVLEDPAATLGLDAVLQPDVAQRFKGGLAPSSALNYGSSDSAYWLRLRLSNASDVPVQRYLEIANARLSDVQFYQPDNNGAYQTRSTGAAQPFATRPYKNHGFVFVLNVPAHAEQVVFLRLRCNGTMLIPARLWSPTAFHAYERNDYGVQALYFGLAAGLILFNILLFAALRDAIYLFYVGFSLSMVLYFASAYGLAHEFVWPLAAGWADMAPQIVRIPAVIMLALVARRMLDTRQCAPRLDTILRVIAWGGLPLMAGVLGPQGASFRIGNIYLLVSFGCIFAVAVYCAYKRQRSAYFFVGAFAAFFLGVMALLAAAIGWLPSSTFTTNGAQFGSALEMLLLALALADRYHALRRAKETAQSEAIQAQAEALEVRNRLVETLQTSERQLEERVERRTAELRAVLKFNETILVNSPFAMGVFAANGDCVEVNGAYAELVGETRETLLAMNFNRSKAWRDSGLDDDCRTALATTSPQRREVRIANALGKELYLECRLLPIEVEEQHHLLVQLVDLTERKRHEEELRGFAFNDALTQLPNRRLLMDRLTHAVRTSKRADSHGALLFLDLNKFKELNDAHGHEAGDQLLIEVARRLQQVTRDTDTVARIGGDEFVVLLEGLGADHSKAAEAAALMAGKIRQALADEFAIGPIAHCVSASVGVTLFHGDQADPDQIIKDADAAMYQAKRAQAR